MTCDEWAKELLQAAVLVMWARWLVEAGSTPVGAPAAATPQAHIAGPSKRLSRAFYMGTLSSFILCSMQREVGMLRHSNGTSRV